MAKSTEVQRNEPMSYSLTVSRDNQGIKIASCSGKMQSNPAEMIRSAEYQAREIKVRALIKAYSMPRETAEVLNDLSQNYRVPLARVTEVFQKYGVIGDEKVIARNNCLVLQALKELEQISADKEPVEIYRLGSDPTPSRDLSERIQTEYHGDSENDFREHVQNIWFSMM
jgi:hypothetical protein